MDDEKKSVQSSPYTITTSIIENKLNITLDDNKTKQTYKSSFTPHALKQCGFNDKQVKNLSAIKKLIETAKSGRSDLELTVSIQTNDGKEDNVNINDDPDDAAEGVHGIDVTKPKDIIAPAAAAVELAVIKITKEDDFFGTTQFILKLAKVEREQSQVNADMIRDMMVEMKAIRQKLEECENKARGQEAKIVKLEEITKSQATEIEEKTKGISGLIARVEVLEQKANAQRNQNKKLEDDVLEKQRKIEELEGVVREQGVQIEELGKNKEVVNALREGVERLKQGLEKRGKEIRILNDGKDAQGKEIKDLVKITKSQQGKIGKLEKETQALGEEQKEDGNKSKIHIAKYASTKEKKWIQWNVVKIKPTLDGMISKMEENKSRLYFGVAGLYRIIYSWSSDEEENKSKYRSGWVNLNGDNIALSTSLGTNANGQLTTVINIQKNDYIACVCEEKKGTDWQDCGLIIERLSDCV